MSKPTFKIGPKKEAFNLKLLKFTEVQTRTLKPVSSLHITENANTTDFHEKGLYSTEIFGKVGTKQRDRQFSYIHIKTSILHPLIYRTLQRLKSFYVDIMEGRVSAVWDGKTKSFVKSNGEEARTGYAFFMEHWNDITFEKTTSLIRSQRVDLINMWRSIGIYDKIAVLPAGLRDIEMDDNGRPREHDINPMYRKIISVANTVASSKHGDQSVYDKARCSLQSHFNILYDTIERLIQGKNGFIEDRWTGRRVIHGTRNVVSSQDPSMEDIDDPLAPDITRTILGIWQLSKAALPVTIHRLKEWLLDDIFSSVEGGVRLVDPKTLESEDVALDSTVYDRWSSNEGIEKIISIQSNKDIRSKPITIQGRYLALVYRPKNKMVFRVFRDINELPEEFDSKDVHPLTFIEMIYLCNYHGWNRLAVINTRYPVAGEESTLPSIVRVATTVDSDRRIELDDNWQPMESDEYTASAYPILENPSYVDATKLSPFKIEGAQGDYDGDTFSNNVVFTEEAVNEVHRYMNQRSAHISTSGEVRNSTDIDTTKYTMHTLTGDPIDGV